MDDRLRIPQLDRKFQRPDVNGNIYDIRTLGPPIEFAQAYQICDLQGNHVIDMVRRRHNDLNAIEKQAEDIVKRHLHILHANPCNARLIGRPLEVRIFEGNEVYFDARRQVL